MGPQLDPSHTTNDSEVKEVTQVISALAQNPTTAHLAAEAYENIANVIKQAAKPYLKYMREDNRATNGQDDRITSGNLYKYIAEKFVKTVTNSKGDTIAKVLLQSFSSDVNIPFSNQNFFVPFVRDIITRMNNEFITRYYCGTGAVLIPSHGIIQLYDIPQTDGTVLTVSQKDLIKEALKNFDPSQYDPSILLSNELIVSTHINKLLLPLPTTWDKIQLGDTILINKEPKQEAIEILKIGNYKEQLASYLEEVFSAEEVELGAQQLMSRFLD